MPNEDLIRLLRSTGLAVFVEYYGPLSDFRLSNQDVVELLPAEYTLSARRTRVSCGRRIIERGLAADGGGARDH